MIVKPPLSLLMEDSCKSNMLLKPSTK